jgi:hypothetical protein
MTQDAVVDMVATNPYLLSKVLDAAWTHAGQIAEADRNYLASALVATAKRMASDGTQESVATHDHGALRTHKRDAAQWAELLGELATVLGNGQFYGRDLPVIDEPLVRVVDRYTRRLGERGR